MRFLYKGKWVEYDGLCDDAKCPDNLNGHCHKEYWKEYECKERKKEKDAMATAKAQIIVSGNCVVCGKQLSRGRLFVCEECESNKTSEANNERHEVKTDIQ